MGDYLVLDKYKHGLEKPLIVWKKKDTSRKLDGCEVPAGGKGGVRCGGGGGGGRNDIRCASG